MTRLATTVLALVVGLAGCARVEAGQSPTSIPRIPGISATPEIGEATSITIEPICETSKELQPQDCEALPSILDGASYNRDTDGSTIAQVAQGVRYLDSLSEEYRTAIEDALQLPIVKYATDVLGISVVFSLEDGAMSNGDYDLSGKQKDGSTSENGTINIMLNASTGGTDLLPTRGALKAVLAHEAAHAVYHRLEVELNNNPRLRSIMDAMLTTCNKDLDIVTKAVLDNGTDAYTKQLDAFTTALREAGVSSSAVLAPFSVDGKTYIVTNQDKADCGFDSADNTLRRSMTKTAYEQLISNSKVANEIDYLSGLVTTSFGDRMTSTTEGPLLEGMTAQNLGHPYDNLSERFASTIALILFAPDAFKQATEALTDERRTNQYELLVEIGNAISELNKEQPSDALGDLSVRVEALINALR